MVPTLKRLTTFFSQLKNATKPKTSKHLYNISPPKKKASLLFRAAISCDVSLFLTPIFVKSLVFLGLRAFHLAHRLPQVRYLRRSRRGGCGWHALGALQTATGSTGRGVEDGTREPLWMQKAWKWELFLGLFEGFPIVFVGICFFCPRWWFVLIWFYLWSYSGFFVNHMLIFLRFLQKILFLVRGSRGFVEIWGCWKICGSCAGLAAC